MISELSKSKRLAHRARTPRTVTRARAKMGKSLSLVYNTTMSEPGLHNYVLRSGEPAAVRLRLLADVVGPTTESFLDRLCLQNGMHCLDVGCGIGAVTVPIAE